MVEWLWIGLAFVVGYYLAFIIFDFLAPSERKRRCEECHWRRMATDFRDAEIADYRAMASGDVSGIGKDPNLSDLGAEHNLYPEDKHYVMER